MKIMIEVSGGMVTNIAATQEVSIYLIDHDNLKVSAGHDPDGAVSLSDIEDARQAMQPHRITWEEGCEKTPEFDECLTEALADYLEDCGQCECRHPKGFAGDCRDNRNRF